MKKSSCTILLFIITSVKVFSQTDINIDTSRFDFPLAIWVQGGLMPLSDEGYKLNVNYKSHYFGLSYHTYKEATLRFFGDVTPDESVIDYSVLYGIAGRPKKYLLFTASSGIGIAETVTRGNLISKSSYLFFSSKIYEKKRNTVVMLPINLQASINVWGCLGLSLEFQAGINSVKSYATMLASIQIGLIRTHRIY